MLNSIRCTNYRCFEDTLWLELAPLTILVGCNSSGKTSLLHALKLLALTAEATDPAVTLKLMDRDYDFGSYQDLVHCHDIRRRLGFQLEADVVFRSWGGDRSERKTRCTLDIEYQYLPKRKEIQLARLALCDDKGEWFTATIDKYTNRIHAALRGYEPQHPLFSRLTFYRQGFTVYSVFPSFLFNAEGDDADQLMRSVSDVNVAQREFSRLLQSVGHLGPLRSAPKRAYLHSGETPAWVGTGGEAALQLYTSLQRRGWPEDKKRLSLIQDSLRRLGFLSSFKSQDVGARWQEFITKHSVSGLDASLADTGFGASQVLPVIIALFAVSSRSTLLIEQPEIHLHPAAQAELGSVVASAVTPSKRIVLETHSENLILRIQREVAAEGGRLRSTDVAFYYVLPKEGQHAIIRLGLDDKGRFTTPWPGGFFEEGYQEALKLSADRNRG